MSRLINVKRYKRGATHSDGSTFLCIRCRIEKKEALIHDRGGRKKANQAVVTAISVNDKTKSRLPIGWCEKHIPEDIKEDINVG